MAVPAESQTLPSPPDFDGKFFMKPYDIFGNETVDFVADDNNMYHTAYEIFCGLLFLPDIGIAKTTPACLPDVNELTLKRNVPSTQVVPGALVMRKQECRVEANPVRIFEIPGSGSTGWPLASSFIHRGENFIICPSVSSST